jgi:hypothetical protein
MYVCMYLCMYVQTNYFLSVLFLRKMKNQKVFFIQRKNAKNVQFFTKFLERNGILMLFVQFFFWKKI